MQETKTPAASEQEGPAAPARSRLFGATGGASKRNILAVEPIKKLFRWRKFQFALQAPNVAIYVLVILTGLYGTQVGAQNFATVITWTVWWSAIIFTFLFAGRLWCLMCPFAAMAEWLQRLALWSVKRKTFGLNWRWPLRLRNLYLATLTFLILTWADHQFGLVHNPLYTAYFVLIILTAAVVVALLFERRTFCRFVCPIGGLIGTYSLFAGSELRVADPQVCRDHKDKSCVLGDGRQGYGCPVLEYPGTMTSNYSCTLCTECVKTCPKGNIVFNVRPFAHDLVSLNERRLRLDMAILAMILLGLPTLQTIVMIAPWEGWMQAAADLTSLPSTLVFVGVFLLGALAIPLGLFTLTAQASALFAGAKEVSQRRLFLNLAFAFVPIGLMMHLAHNVKHLFGEIHVAIPVISDPFGWGWNLLGTAGLRLSSLVADNLMTLLQFGLVLLGQGFAVYVAYRTCRRLFGANDHGLQRALVPMLVLMVAWSAFNLWVLNEPMMARH